MLPTKYILFSLVPTPLSKGVWARDYMLFCWLPFLDIKKKQDNLLIPAKWLCGVYCTVLSVLCKCLDCKVRGKGVGNTDLYSINHYGCLGACPSPTLPSPRKLVRFCIGSDCHFEA